MTYITIYVFYAALRCFKVQRKDVVKANGVIILGRAFFKKG